MSSVPSLYWVQILTFNKSAGLCLVLGIQVFGLLDVVCHGQPRQTPATIKMNLEIQHLKLSTKVPQPSHTNVHKSAHSHEEHTQTPTSGMNNYIWWIVSDLQTGRFCIPSANKETISNLHSFHKWNVPIFPGQGRILFFPSTVKSSYKKYVPRTAGMQGLFSYLCCQNQSMRKFTDLTCTTPGDFPEILCRIGTNPDERICWWMYQQVLHPLPAIQLSLYMHCRMAGVKYHTGPLHYSANT